MQAKQFEDAAGGTLPLLLVSAQVQYIHTVRNSKVRNPCARAHNPTLAFEGVPVRFLTEANDGLVHEVRHNEWGLMPFCARGQFLLPRKLAIAPYTSPPFYTTRVYTKRRYHGECILTLSTPLTHTIRHVCSRRPARAGRHYRRVGFGNSSCCLCARARAGMGASEGCAVVEGRRSSNARQSAVLVGVRLGY